MASNVAQRMEYVGGAAPTTLSGDLSDSGSQFNLADGTNYPTGTVGPFTLVINKGGATEEIVLCDSRVNEQITVAPNGRGYAGTVASTHSAGESVAPCWSSSAADQDNLHNASTSGVHGVAGNVVGDKDAQTLTNKVIDGSKNTLSNIPEAAVTGLVSALQTLTGSESTDASNIVANAASIKTLQDQVAAGLGLLAHVDYTGSAISVHVANSGSPVLTVVDSTNLSPSFTVPSSGTALIRVSGALNKNSNTLDTVGIGWLNHPGAAQVGRTQTDYVIPISGYTAYTKRFSVTQTLTGLTAGQTLQLDLALGSVNPSSNPLTVSDVTIEVWAAS